MHAELRLRCLFLLSQDLNMLRIEIPFEFGGSAQFRGCSRPHPGELIGKKTPSCRCDLIGNQNYWNCVVAKQCRQERETAAE